MRRNWHTQATLVAGALLAAVNSTHAQSGSSSPAELSAFSDVVAFIEITEIEESDPHPGNTGSCLGPQMGYEVHAKFTWIDRLAQCPWVTVDADTPQVLRFFRGTYSKPTETGRYLVFLLQTDINEYALAALPSDALFNLDSPRSDPADLPRGRLAKAHLRSLPESELRTRVSALTIPDQRQEFEASSVSEMHENCAPLKGSMCRLRAFTREAPGEQARSPYRAFLHVIACYVPSDQLDRDALVKSEGPDPYHRCGVRLEGNRVDGPDRCPGIP